MPLVTRWRSAAAVVVGAGITVSACGVGGASHVVGGSLPAGASATVPAHAAPAGTTGSTGAPATVLDQQTLSQVDAELAPVDSGLTQANADLDNPQGDS